MHHLICPRVAAMVGVVRPLLEIGTDWAGPHWKSV